MAGRSDEAGKPVWGRQEKMAEQLGRCRASIIRYSQEAETLGYLRVFRSKPERDTSTGRWHRRRSNSYYFCLPPKQAATQQAPRRRQRAPYCVVRARGGRRPDLCRAEATSSPSRGAPTGAAPAHSGPEPAETPGNTWTGHMSDTVKAAIADARQKLASSPVGHGAYR